MLRMKATIRNLDWSTDRCSTKTSTVTKSSRPPCPRHQCRKSAGTIEKADRQAQVASRIADALCTPNGVAHNKQHCSFLTNYGFFITFGKLPGCAVCRIAANWRRARKSREKPGKYTTFVEPFPCCDAEWLPL